MASTPPLAWAQDHKDIRSESLPYKRDNDHKGKWANGTRVPYGYRGPFEVVDGVEQPLKFRPERTYPRWKDYTHTGNVTAKQANKTPIYMRSRGATRISHKNLAYAEIADPESLSLSIHTLGKPRGESIIDPFVYSFDAAGPKQSVRLDKLVDQAEEKFRSRETDQLVKNEYEILDGEGETLKSKKGKKSPTVKAEKETKTKESLLDDDDYELV